MTSKTKYNLRLRIFEQPFANPKSFEEAEKNRTPIELTIQPSDRVVRGRSVDVCLRLAREHVEKSLKRRVRSVSIGPEGISVVVYGKGINLPSGGTVSEKSLRKGLPR